MECPSCHNEVKVTEAQFGALYTCAKCQAVYFVNFDGNPEYDSSPPTSVIDGSIISAQPAQGGTTVGMNTAIANAQPIPADFSLTGMYQQEIASEPTNIQPPALSALESALSDIESFGNQNVDVNLTFNLRVSGLDTKDLVGFFFDSINDPKFGWMPDEIMKSIANGQCDIKKIKPVAAHILAKRLQFVDVTLEWSFENAI